MPHKQTRRGLLAFVVIVQLVSQATSDAFAQGVVLPGVGPINRSMGGAAVAAPLDSIGAMHWNPASIRGLARSELAFGAELLYAQTKLNSTFGSVGDGTFSESGVNVLPTTALVYHPDDSIYSVGLGVFTIGGFGVNYPSSTTNPALAAQPNGAGAVFSKLALVQFAPTLAVDLTDRIAFGFAPTVTMADLSLDPAFFAAPDDANGIGGPTYPGATHGRLHWGLGFQAGIYVTTDSCWSFGASFKSPQWFEEFHFNSADELGAARELRSNLDYPMIVSLGVAYRGFQRLTLATDIRYLDYKHTDGFGDRASFAPDGSATGLGWDSVFSVSAGAQYQYNDGLSFRLGYLFAENPVGDDVTFFNIASSAIYEHAIFMGATKAITEQLHISLAYLHSFPNSIAGPIETPAGIVPTTNVLIEQETDGLVMGAHVYF